MADDHEMEPFSPPPYHRQGSGWPRPRPTDRQDSLAPKRSFKETVNKFFLGDGDFEREKWHSRSRRLHSKSLGVKVKEPPEGMAQSEDTLDSSVFETVSRSGSRRLPHPIDPLARRTMRQDSVRSYGYGRQYSRQISRMSHLSTASSARRAARHAPAPRNRRESVFHMAYDGVKTLVGAEHRKRKPLMHSRSFAPQSISSYWDDMELKSPGAESVIEEVIDDVFFDVATPTSHLTSPGFARLLPNAPPDHLRPIPERRADGPAEDEEGSRDAAAGDAEPDAARASAVRVDVDDEDGGHLPPDKRFLMGPTAGGWQSGREKPQPLPGTPEDMLDAPFDGIERAGATLKRELYDYDNSNRREVGKGFVGRLMGREYRKDRLDSEIMQEIEEMTEHRPYFTYWITFVQIVIYIFAVAVYGLAPVGFDQTVVSAEVNKPNLAIEKVQYFEEDNLWVGPRRADLIHLGAKYSPCMRKDENVEAAIVSDRLAQNRTACCVRNDGSGCMQAPKDQCSSTLSTWFKWTADAPGPDDRLSGSVCGQDPKYCTSPASSDPFRWADDITLWPLCTETSEAPSTEQNKHMNCELTARPCCVGIQGECIITSREYCDFRKGYFHEEATLCSQVSCMSQICGMIPFLDPERPDQIYRLFTSLFLHAGLIQLLVTILFQFFIMRDLEKLAGWFRISIIYIGSGIAGALSSAIFLPYHVEAGPSGSQFGLLACLIVEVIQNWQILQNPAWALGKQLIFLVALFIFGLLPYVDNYAHLIGFVFGFFLSFALLPYITFNKLDKRGKLIGIVVCLFTAVGLFALLIVLFYVTPVYNCPNCHYFTCIPFTPNFCKSMEVKIGRSAIY